jgi:hypothetical protein
VEHRALSDARFFEIDSSTSREFDQALVDRYRALCFTD